jgi:hypothetical protein
MRRGDRQEPHPGGEAVFRRDARVRHRPQDVRAHVGDGSGQEAAVRKGDLNVDRVCSLSRRGERAGLCNDPFHDRRDGFDHALAEHAGRERAAGRLGRDRGLEGDLGEPRLEQTLADAPFLEGIEFDAEALVHLVLSIGKADAEPPPQECPDRMRREAHEVVDLDHRRLDLRQRFGQEGLRPFPRPD